MKRYPEYKDTGVEWLGEAPAHWTIASLKWSFSIVSGSTPKSDDESLWDGGIAWATPADLSSLAGIYIETTTRTISKSGLTSCAASLVPAGSIIISTRAPIGSIAVTTLAMTTNQGCRSLVGTKRTNSLFYYFLLGSVVRELNARGKGTTFLELSADELGAFLVPVPPRSEQTAIAAFLDRETAKIDGLIAEQEKLIALLKEKRQAVISHAVTKGLDANAPMKDSGVEWLGQVPAHWRLSAIKRVASIVGRIGYRGYTVEDLVGEGEGAIALGGANLSSAGRLDLNKLTFLSWTKYEESPEIKVSWGDLLVGQRGTCGRVVIVDQDIGPATINPSLVVLKNLNLDGRFLCYFIMGEFVQNVFGTYLSTTAVPMLSQEQIGSVRVCVPSEQEQSEIVAFLNRELARLDELNSETQHAIALLQERRSALISAAVTGKIDVRGLAPATAEAA